MFGQKKIDYFLKKVKVLYFKKGKKVMYLKILFLLEWVIFFHWVLVSRLLKVLFRPKAGSYPEPEKKINLVVLFVCVFVNKKVHTCMVRENVKYCVKIS